jgi:hypothetical protein
MSISQRSYWDRKVWKVLTIGILELHVNPFVTLLKTGRASRSQTGARGSMEGLSPPFPPIQPLF